MAPGASASTTLQVTSPSEAADGFYAVGVMAANSAEPSYPASTTVTYVIVSGLDVAASTDQSSYSTNQTVSITAQAAANGSPVANANVSFHITKANGSVVTGTATTGANGVAVYKLRLKKQDPLGLYQVGVTANLGGVSGTANATFTLQ